MKHYFTSTPEQHAKHDRHAKAFSENMRVLCDLAANHAEARVRSAAYRAIMHSALLKADPNGDDALCGPKVKQAIEHAVVLLGEEPLTEIVN